MKLVMMEMLSRRRRRYHNLHLYLHFLWFAFLCISNNGFCNGQETAKLSTATTTTVDIGVIVNMDTYVGRTSKMSMELAVEDLNAAHNSVRLLLHTRDSKGDPVEAAAAAIDLLKNYQVKAILAGPQQSREIEFVAEIGMKTKVPILSFTPTAGSSSYSIKMAQSDTSELRGIASIARHFNWTQIVPIYVYDDDGIILFLSDELAKVGVAVPYRCRISESATDEQILTHLNKLKKMQTRVFLVHKIPYSLASRLFLLVKKAGMMTKGYAWIITGDLLDRISTTNYDSMEGVIGVKPYIPNTDHQLDRFSERWKDKFLQENSGDDYHNVHRIGAFGLWAYDCVSLLAKAVEQISSSSINSNFTKHQNSNNNLTDIQMIGLFESGPQLLKSIHKTRFKGISGDIDLKNGELPISPFQVINLVGNESRQIGIWRLAYDDDSRIGVVRLEKNVTWPGNSPEIPRGWERKKLKVGVPVKSGFGEFINVTNNVVKGFCREVFDAVMAELPFNVTLDYQPFEKLLDGSWASAGNYDALVHAINSSEYEYDAVIGDIAITGNRLSYADFTLAYSETGVSMIVPVRRDDRRSGWIFTKPLTRELWITTGVFFIITGVVVWILEHRVNKAFHDPPPAKQAGLVMWFSFSTLVSVYTEKVVSNLSRFVLTVWVFVVMVLTSSYTASLTSFLTAQQLQPTVTDISDIIRNGDKIGYQQGSFVPEMLKSLYDVDEGKLHVLSTSQDYNDALSNGTVAAIVDELPYLRVVLGKYCSKFKMVGPTYKTAGFGFAFPRGSPLVPEVSRAILKLIDESSEINNITNKWFKNTSCYNSDADNVSSNSLKVDSFKGLFLIAGISSTLALTIFLIRFLHQNRDILTSQDMTLYQKLVALAKTFYAPAITDGQNNGSDNTIEIADLNDSQSTSRPDQEASPRDGGRSPAKPPPVSLNRSYSIISQDI